MYFLTRISPELSLFLDTQKMKHFTIIDLQFSAVMTSYATALGY